MSSTNSSEYFSNYRKIIYSLLFLIGLAFSYATFMPIGISCAGFLLFQKKSKHFNVLGLILLSFQVLVMCIFIYVSIEAQLIYPA